MFQISDFSKSAISISSWSFSIVFHDCVSDACDGCIKLDQDSNAGLDDIVADLELLYPTYSSEMSKADLWTLVAIKVRESQIENGTLGDSDFSCNFELQ